MTDSHRSVLRNPFVLFFAIGTLAWTAVGAGVSGDASSATLISLVVGFLILPATGAYSLWREVVSLPGALRQRPPSPFAKAVIGLVASSALACVIGWAVFIAPNACAPDDFECRTVGSQGELAFLFVVLVTCVSIGNAGLGAMLGSWLHRRRTASGARG